MTISITRGIKAKDIILFLHRWGNYLYLCEEEVLFLEKIVFEDPAEE